MTQTTDLKAIADALRQHDRFLVVTHENPDGDALGSLLASTLALRQLGKDVVMYLAGATPLPARVRVHAARRARTRTRRTTPRSACCSPSTAPRRTGSATRPPLARPRSSRHRPPSRQHALRRRQPHRRRRVVDRRSARATSSPSSESSSRRSSPSLSTSPSSPTPGRFQYANTTPKALRLAAELVEAGADIHAVFQQVYESVEFAKLKLLARALDRAEVLEGGRIVVSHLLRTDFAEVGASEPYSEGSSTTCARSKAPSSPC